ncbi:MAG: hypothetical protein Q9191_001035 [Dirinaria sp. TL-2023a]
MDLIEETPTKRRRLENGHAAEGRGYNSQDDSGDDLFKDHETVATVPLPGRLLTSTSTDPNPPHSSPRNHVTQPTQIIEQKSPVSGRKPSIIQVAASSPIPPSRAIATPNGTPKLSQGGTLASVMAPAGTAFRLPMGVKKPPVIDLSDDEGAMYRGGPSDEELTQDRRVDIKPSTFVHSTRDTQPKGSISRFREITAGAFYKPLESSKNPGQSSIFKGSVYDTRNRDEKQSTSRLPTTAKRSADIMANAYGGARRAPKSVQQTAPAKAQPPKDISLDEIGDFQLRTKVGRARTVFPSHSILQCKDALLKRKCNYDDALELLSTQEPQHLEIDLTTSDTEDMSTTPAKQKRDQQKAVKTPIKSIQERWTATHFQPKQSQMPVSSSPVEPPPPKPRRRLVQGRKRLSPPTTKSENSVPTAPSPSVHRQTPDSDASDSALGSEAEGDPAIMEDKVLNFFNTCSIADLEDIAAITTEIAGIIFAQKPFGSLADIRTISDNKATAGSKRKGLAKKPIGDKVVDKCIEMWTGYDAVDDLVRQCDALGRPIAEEMKRWGINAFGGSKDGELDLVALERPSPCRDSAIGTPTTIGQLSEEDDGEIKRAVTALKKPGSLSQPALMGKDVVLKDYQIVGVNWLSLLFEQNLSAILADDMGLGKTCQVIAFLAHLKEKGVKGLHLIVVPASTLENWLREFSIFCPELKVIPFYAELKEREAVREKILENVESIDAIVTTYGMAKMKDETKFLRKLSPVVCVYDEGHMLKNSESRAYAQLMRISADFRLLLTGTPLQNNLRELVSLLGFILPSVFRKHSQDLSYIFSHRAKTTDNNHAALLSEQRIARAKAMMTPFVLRRKKHQVLKYLPAKTRRIEYCELTSSQLEIYGAEKQKALKVIQNRAAGIKTGNESSNIMMALRKASIHPLLFRRHYTDDMLAKMSKDCIKEPQFAKSNPNLVYEDMEVMTDHELLNFCEQYPNTMSPFLLSNSVCFDSGKVTALVTLLKTYLANGDRVLIFSQFVLVLNLLEPVLDSLDIQYSRLDGGTAISTRQPLIDAFTASDPPIPVFLLSTKAGGAGINLACANKIIIFDSSFNPQDDIQAENRAHRVGQKREVEVVRLVSKGTVEEQILALGETKVALDERVAGGVDAQSDTKAEKEGMKMVEEMMLQTLRAEQEAGQGARGTDQKTKQ